MVSVSRETKLWFIRKSWWWPARRCCEDPARVQPHLARTFLGKKKRIGDGGGVGLQTTGIRTYAYTYAYITRAHALVIRHPRRRIYLFSSWRRGLRCWRPTRDDAPMFILSEGASLVSLPKRETRLRKSFRSESIHIPRESFSLLFFSLSQSLSFFSSVRDVTRLAAAVFALTCKYTPRRAAPGVDNDACIDAVSPAAHRFPFV